MPWSGSDAPARRGAPAWRVRRRLDRERPGAASRGSGPMCPSRLRRVRCKVLCCMRLGLSGYVLAPDTWCFVLLIVPRRAAGGMRRGTCGQLRRGSATVPAGASAYRLWWRAPSHPRPVPATTAPRSPTRSAAVETERDVAQRRAWPTATFPGLLALGGSARRSGGVTLLVPGAGRRCRPAPGSSCPSAGLRKSVTPEVCG